MDSKHGAEICELVGLYLLEDMECILNQEYIGIYRDAGLTAIQKKNKWKRTRSWEIDENMHEFAKAVGLNIEK